MGGLHGGEPWYALETNKMKFYVPSTDQTSSVLRHIYTAVGTATAVLVVVGLSQSDATALGLAVHKIGDGVASIVAGVGMLIPVASAIYAAWAQSPFAKLMAMQHNPEIHQVIAIAGTPTGALAAAIPGDKITTAPIAQPLEDKK
jgi:hypothetical protein